MDSESYRFCYIQNIIKIQYNKKTKQNFWSVVELSDEMSRFFNEIYLSDFDRFHVIFKGL